MSENKNIPEIIYVPEKMLLDIESGTSLITNKISSLNEVEYILKSKYDELLKEKEELEKENEWISVEDELRLPDIGYKNQIQLFAKREFQPDFEVLQGWREKYGFCCSSMREDEYLKVTHWKPLPKAPIIKPTEK